MAALTMTAMPLLASAQFISPGTPGGFKTRNLGGGADVNATVTPPPVAPSNPALVQTLHARIQGLIRLRRYDEAEAATMELISKDPATQYAQLYLRQIQAGRAAMETPLRQMIVPTVDFREADLTDVVKFLGEVSAEISPDKRPMSFVLQLPPGTTTPRVTLSLRQIPMLDVLRYITGATGVSFKIEPHAVVIYKAQAPAPKAPEPGIPSNP